MQDHADYMEFQVAESRLAEGAPPPYMKNEPVGQNTVATDYLELTKLIERLHRRFLDVVRAELDHLGVKDLNAVQAMLLANIGDEEIAIRDLIDRGYYLGSNVSYNIKKLTEFGYLEQERAVHDKRSVMVRLTDKALQLVQAIREMEQSNSKSFSKHDGTSAKRLAETTDTLRLLERTWSDYIHYGRR